MYIRLSYDLSASTPMPPDLPAVAVWPRRSIQAGDISNWSLVEMCTHCGTHLDAPWHFNDEGRRITDLPIEFFFFDRPFLLEVPKEDAQLITAGDLEPHLPRIAASDLLLLRTGFSRHRSTEPNRYIVKSPGLSTSGAECLAAFPNLRGVGLDTLSVACHEHLQEGIEAHRILFRDLGVPRILVEDVNLAVNLEGLTRVMILPIFIASMDGGPCTIVAEV